MTINREFVKWVLVPQKTALKAGRKTQMGGTVEGAGGGER